MHKIIVAGTSIASPAIWQWAPTLTDHADSYVLILETPPVPPPTGGLVPLYMFYSRLRRV